MLISENAAKTHLQEFHVRLNNLICIITYKNKYLLMTNLYKNFNILRLPDVYKLEVAKYTHQLHNNKLPKSLHNNDYVKINKTHNFKTR